MSKPITRIRDQIRKLKPQGVITYEEWQQISDNASRASAFLSEKNPVYLTLKEDLDNARETLLENRLREYREFQYSTASLLRKIFTTPKKVQVDELTGQYKYIKSLLEEVESWISIKKDYERQEADGVITIDREGRSEG